MKEIVFPSWIKIISKMNDEEISVSSISKKTNITFSHTLNVINILERKNLLKTTRRKNIHNDKVMKVRRINLTRKGMIVKEAVLKIFKELENEERN